MDQWNIFGHIGRVTAEWVLGDMSDKEFETKYAMEFQASIDKTVNVVKELGWFPKDETQLQERSKLLENAVKGFNDCSENKKRAWLSFASLLLSLAE